HYLELCFAARLSVAVPSRRACAGVQPATQRKEPAVVFGTKRDNKPDSELREDVVGSLYPDSFPNEDDMAQNSMEYRRGDPGNESVIDHHARVHDKYVSDRDTPIVVQPLGECGA